MGNLRTPRLHEIHPTTPSASPQPPRGDAAAEQAIPSHPLVLFGGFLAVLLIGGALMGLRALAASGAAPAAAPTAAVVLAATATPPPLTPTPDCVRATGQLALIDDLERRADWKRAASTAEATLDMAQLCREERGLLLEKAVGNGIRVLLQERFPNTLDTELQQELVERYLALKARAKAAGIAFPTSLRVAADAYGRSQHLLAKVALQ